MKDPLMQNMLVLEGIAAGEEVETVMSRDVNNGFLPIRYPKPG